MRKPQLLVLIDPQSQDAATFIQLPFGPPLCAFDSSPENNRIGDSHRQHLIVLGNKHALAVGALLLRKPLHRLAKHATSAEFVAGARARVGEVGEAIACEVDHFIRNPPVTTVRLAWRAAKFSIHTAIAVPRSIPGLLRSKPRAKPYLSTKPVSKPKPAAPVAKPKPPTSQPATSATNPQHAHPMMQQLAAMGFKPPGYTPAVSSAPAAAAAAPKPAAAAAGAAAGVAARAAAPAAAAPGPARGLPPAPRPAAAQPTTGTGSLSARPAVAKGLGAGLGGGLPARSKPAGQAAATPAAPAPPAVPKRTEAVPSNDDYDDDDWEEADEEDMEDMEGL